MSGAYKMKDATMTFADLTLPAHPERKCFYNFTCWSAWRLPTKEELAKDTEERSTIYILEQQLFYYKPFTMKNMSGEIVGRC